METDMNKETLARLKDLHLWGMYNAFKGSLENYNRDTMTIDKFVSMLVNSEWDERYNRGVSRLIKSAGFRYNASIEELDYTRERGLDRNQMERLASLTFIDEKKDILITGSTGTGKTYIASALGYCACLKGLRVLYRNTGRLLGELKVSRANNNILKDMKKIQRADLLILDDFGLTPMDNTARQLLMDIIDDRYDCKSTILSSQIPVDTWYDAIGESTVADAILDRIIHNSIRIELYGESMRKRTRQKSI